MHLDGSGKRSIKPKRKKPNIGYPTKKIVFIVKIRQRRYPMLS